MKYLPEFSFAEPVENDITLEMHCRRFAAGLA